MWPSAGGGGGGCNQISQEGNQVFILELRSLGNIPGVKFSSRLLEAYFELGGLT